VALEHRELVSKWFHRIDQLPENQRTAIVLVRIEEFSPAEAAAIMNLSVKAVRKLYGGDYLVRVFTHQGSFVERVVILKD
jgi:hypothetical protein